jgi:hypothetical protein
LPDFTQDLDSSSPGTLTKIIPGKIVWDELSAYYFEYFRMSATNGRWAGYCEGFNLKQSEKNQTMMKASLFFSDPYNMEYYNYYF